MTMSTQEISDRLEIFELIARYSVALDSRDYDALDELFTNDAVLDYTATGAIRGSLAEMKTFIADAFTMFTGTQHLTTGTTLRFAADGNTAHGKSACHNPMVFGGELAPRMMIVGLWYVDTFVRTADGWRFKERIEQQLYTTTVDKVRS
ncbi:MAG TPA: nuclear transport factor 2 family protein [Acidimicrobiales bacterium]|jgi:ketosteroid isomerase-like protein|nr:nuclear transport factor 2 family protein [Acidimicrobiales bacterium]